MFPVTQWTDLARATLHGDSAGRAALESLCRTYWEPVRQAVRMKPWAKPSAEDLVQSFFLQFLESGVLKKADRERGRFRSFLQGVLENWLMDEYRRQNAVKRGGGQQTLSLDELEESGNQPADPETEGENAVAHFDRAWARAVMSASLNRVRAEYSAKHGDDAFQIIGAFLGAGGEAVSYEEAGKRLGLSLAAFKSEVHAWRRRLRECLRAEVRRTVAAPHEIDEEMDYLRSLLAA